MERIHGQKPFLKAMTSAANRNRRNTLIKHANKEQVNAVSEIVLNLLKNNVPLTPVTMARLKPYKQTLRKLEIELYRLKRGDKR